MLLSEGTLDQELKDAEMEFELVRMVRMMRLELWMVPRDITEELMLSATALKGLCKRWQIPSLSEPSQRKKYREARLVLKTKALGYSGSLSVTNMEHSFDENLICAKCGIGWFGHQVSKALCDGDEPAHRINSKAVKRKQRMIEAKAQGMSVTNIAKELNLTLSWVCRVLRES